jgi:hypothetical protein
MLKHFELKNPSPISGEMSEGKRGDFNRGMLAKLQL